MAENDQEQTSAIAAGTNPAGAQFGVQRVYIKDSSFEAPNSPECFREAYSPKIDFSITSKNQVVDEEKGVYEVVLKLTADVKQDDKSVFLAEVHQAGIFEIKGIDDAETLARVLSVTCPTILFPYGREAIDSLIIKGSFPALMLAPVSFEAIYAQAQQQRAAAAQEPSESVPAS